MNYFPDKPWQIGDEFENETTGVVYRYDGTKWIPTSDTDPLVDYLPLTGGTLTGNLNVGGQLKVTGEREFRVEYADGTNFYRVRPDNNTVTVKGAVNADGRVKGSELVSTKLTSGQSSNLQIYRGNGADEQRKMLIGTDSVNFDVGIRLVGSDVNGSVHKDIQVLNGTKMYVSDEGGEIITFGGSGAFYRGAISQPDHIANKAYADALVEDGPFLPLTGGDLSGQLNINVNSGTALSINSNKVKFWSSGAVELNGYTAFKDNELVTKAYVDNAIEADGAGGGGGYVVPQWRWTNNLWDSATDGQWGMLDKDNASTSRFDACRGIWWKGVDKDGNSPYNNAEWQNIEGFFPGPLYIQKDGKSIFRVAQATGIAGLCLLEYVKEQNLFYVGWSDATLGAAFGGYTGVTNGGTYGLLVPEFIYA